MVHTMSHKNVHNYTIKLESINKLYFTRYEFLIHSFVHFTIVYGQFTVNNQLLIIKFALHFSYYDLHFYSQSSRQ